MKRSWGCFWWGVAVLLVIVVAAYAVAYFVTEQGREAAVASLRKPASLEMYERLAMAKRNGIGYSNVDGEDFLGRFDAYEGLFAQQAEKERILGEGIVAQEYGERWNEFNGEVRDWPEDAWRYVRKQSELYQGLIPQIRQVAALGGPVRPLDFSLGFAMDLPHLARMRELARVLGKEAIIKAQEKNMDEAIEDIVAGMRLGDALVCEPVLISQFVRVGIYGTMNGAVCDAFAPGDLSREQVRRLVEHMAGADHRQAYADALAGEAFVGLTGFGQIRGGAARLLREGFSGKDITEYGPFSSDLVPPLLNLDEQTYAETMKRIAEAAELPYAEGVGTLEEIERSTETLPVTRFFSRMLLPSVARACRTQARHEAALDLTQIGLLLELYYAEHGTYPETLDAIAADLGGSVPNDVFTGEPYHYQPADGSFLLYSVGENGVDNGGRHRYLDLDIVWRGRTEQSSRRH